MPEAGGATRSKLRVGVVARSLSLPAWQHEMLRALRGLDCAEIALVVIATPTPAARAPSQDTDVRRGRAARALSRVYRWLDSRFKCAYDAFLVSDAQALLGDIPTASIQIAIAPPHVAAADVARIGAFDLDVLVAHNLDDARPDLAAAARCGVWSLYVGDRQAGFGTPEGFWEVYFHKPVTESGVEIVFGGSRTPQVAYRSFSYTEEISVRLNCNSVYWKTLFFVPRLLARLHARGAEAFFADIAARNADPRFVDRVPRGYPTAREMALQILRTLYRRASDLAERVLKARLWIVLFRFEPDIGSDLASFTKLVAPRGVEWADPFVLVRDRRHYVFLEEFVRAESKAHLSVMTLERDGRHSTPKRILERPYHLSYPFIFEHDGTLYMVPESFDNRTIELYRCVSFPDRWEFIENLFADLGAVDTTLYRDPDRWWLFTGVQAHPGASTWEELCLYHSETLVGGRWTAHPLNPVVSDVRRARPAGALFVRNGRLYRPSQDCSVRYGYAIKVNQVTKLSPEEYEEEEVAAIEPHWDSRLRATHTLNHAGGLTVIDALQPRFRL